MEKVRRSCLGYHLKGIGRVQALETLQSNQLNVLWDGNILVCFAQLNVILISCGHLSHPKDNFIYASESGCHGYTMEYRHTAVN